MCNSLSKSIGDDSGDLHGPAYSDLSATTSTGCRAEDPEERLSALAELIA